MIRVWKRPLQPDALIDYCVGIRSSGDVLKNCGFRSAGGDLFWLIRKRFEILEGKFPLLWGRNVSCYMCLVFLQGITKVPSTGFPAERSDSFSTPDTLARIVFQMSQWLVSIPECFKILCSVSQLFIHVSTLGNTTLHFTVQNLVLPVNQINAGREMRESGKPSEELLWESDDVQ